MDDDTKARVAWLISMRLDHLFRSAWNSIAIERNYRFDTFLGTSSHGTLALRSYFHLKGL